MRTAAFATFGIIVGAVAIACSARDEATNESQESIAQGKCNKGHPCLTDGGATDGGATDGGATCSAKGMACVTDSACCSGLVCSNGTCQGVADAGSLTCSDVGGACLSLGDCCSGLGCYFISSDVGLSCSCSGVGSFCGRDYPCCSGLVCGRGPKGVSSRCYDVADGGYNQCSEYGGNCSTDTDCCYGNVCSNGTCGGLYCGGLGDSCWVPNSPSYSSIYSLGINDCCPGLFCGGTQGGSGTCQLSSEVDRPTVVVTSPSSGTLSDLVEITASASDPDGVVGVLFSVPGPVAPWYDWPWIWTAPYSVTLDTHLWANQSWAITAMAVDKFGNIGTSVPVTVTLKNTGHRAGLDPELGVPRCSTVNANCDSGDLLYYRGSGSVESWQKENGTPPNTIHKSCPDDDSWPPGVYPGYHLNAIDRLRIETLDGSPLQGGKSARILATPYVSPSSDEYGLLDLFYTTTPDSPRWTLITTILVPWWGEVYTAQLTLPSGVPLMAIRAGLRFSDVPAGSDPACFGLDHDDLVFAVAP